MNSLVGAAACLFVRTKETFGHSPHAVSRATVVAGHLTDHTALPAQQLRLASQTAGAHLEKLEENTETLGT